MVHRHALLGAYDVAVGWLERLPEPLRPKMWSELWAECRRRGAVLRFFELYRLARSQGLADEVAQRLYARALLSSINEPSWPEARRLPLARAAYRAKWEAPPSFRVPLASEGGLDYSELISESVIDFLHSARREHGEDMADLRREVARGGSADIRARDLLTLGGLGQDVSAAELPISGEGDARACLGAVRKDGRSLLMVGAHVGLFSLTADALRRVAPGAIRLGASGLVSAGLLSVRSDPDKALYQGIKHLRESGSVVAIGGDGVYGKGGRQTEFLGGSFSFGMGVPFLIYHSKCQPVWHMVGWQDGQPRYFVELGPTPESGERYEAWVERWFDFYLGRLRSVIVGNPWNIRGVAGGLWWQIRASSGINQQSAQGIMIDHET
jgi:hypothetical protein